MGSVPLWGVSKNRSDAAFCENVDCGDWDKPGHLGAGAPAGYACRDLHVDPRVTVRPFAHFPAVLAFDAD